MKNSIFTLIIWLSIQTMGFTQNIGYNISIGVRKTVTVNKKSVLDFRQQFQFTPDIRKYNQKNADLFNDEGYWPVFDQYTDDDDNSTGNDNELDDTPLNVDWEWRSTTSTQYTYRFQPWIRANTGYGFFFNGDEIRHLFRAELDYRPLRHTARKKKLDIAARFLVQEIGRREDSETEWNTLVAPRIDAEWIFKKNHLIVISPSLSGNWEDKKIEFDRWRVVTELTFIYKKIHRYTFSYQYQQRLDKPGKSHGLGFRYEIRF